MKRKKEPSYNVLWYEMKWYIRLINKTKLIYKRMKDKHK